MSGVLLNYIWIFIFLIVGICEVYTAEYINVFKFPTSKFFSENNNKSLNKSKISYILSFTVIWHLLNYTTLLVTNSISYNIFNFLSIYTIFLIITIYCSNFFLGVKKKMLVSYNYLQGVIVVLLTSIYIVVVCDNYILLLLLVEFITTVYYFFFLKNSNDRSFSIIKYKNLISYYLWLSFFTLLFFSATLIYWVYLYGTLNIIELQYLKLNQKIVIFLLISFFWKLGVPLFHFFKLELYRYLDFISLIIFSIVSLVVNSFLFIYLLINLNIVLSYNFTLFLIIICINTILLVQAIDKIFFFYFFALSSINTWLFFIILIIG